MIHYGDHSSVYHVFNLDPMVSYFSHEFLIPPTYLPEKPSIGDIFIWKDKRYKITSVTSNYQPFYHLGNHHNRIDIIPEQYWRNTHYDS